MAAQSLPSVPAPEIIRDWRTVHTELETLGRNRGGWDAAVARRLRDAEQLRIWREVNEPNMFAYIERVLGFGPRSAYDRMRVARELGALPLIEGALDRGELFYSHARALVRVATSETERAWLAATEGKTLREVEAMVSGRAKGDLPDAPSRPELVRHGLSFEVSAQTYALLRQARKALQEEIGEQLDDDRFLALLARRALQPGKGEGPRDQVTHTKCPDCRRTFQEGAGAVVEITAAASETAECAGDHVDSNGKITRRISASTRRSVRARDQGQCQVPWCRSMGDLNLHHIKVFCRRGWERKREPDHDLLEPPSRHPR